jgi:hypothetical protein
MDIFSRCWIGWSEFWVSFLFSFLCPVKNLSFRHVKLKFHVVPVCFIRSGEKKRKKNSCNNNIVNCGSFQYIGIARRWALSCFFVPMRSSSLDRSRNHKKIFPVKILWPNSGRMFCWALLKIYTPRTCCVVLFKAHNRTGFQCAARMRRGVCVGAGWGFMIACRDWTDQITLSDKPFRFCSDLDRKPFLRPDFRVFQKYVW